MDWWPEFEKFLFGLLGAAIGGFFAYLWARWTAREQEAGRIDARDKQLDAIVREVKEVTKAQQDIQSRFAVGLWEYQIRWNQKRDLYATLLGTLTELEHVWQELVKPETPPESVEGLMKTEAQLRDRLHGSVGLARIFLSPAALSSLRTWFEFTTQDAAEMYRRIVTTQAELVEAAVSDLKL